LRLLQAAQTLKPASFFEEKKKKKKGGVSRQETKNKGKLELKGQFVVSRQIIFYQGHINLHFLKTKRLVGD
jgi:hypothetical protein